MKDNIVWNEFIVENFSREVEPKPWHMVSLQTARRILIGSILLMLATVILGALTTQWLWVVTFFTWLYADMLQNNYLAALAKKRRMEAEGWRRAWRVARTYISDLAYVLKKTGPAALLVFAIGCGNDGIDESSLKTDDCLTVVGPQGERGEQGPVGPAGPPGVQGEQGVAGIAGHALFLELSPQEAENEISFDLPAGELSNVWVHFSTIIGGSGEVMDLWDGSSDGNSGSYLYCGHGDQQVICDRVQVLSGGTHTIQFEITDDTIYRATLAVLWHPSGQ